MVIRNHGHPYPHVWCIQMGFQHPHVHVATSHVELTTPSMIIEASYQAMDVINQIQTMSYVR